MNRLRCPLMGGAFSVPRYTLSNSDHGLLNAQVIDLVKICRRWTPINRTVTKSIEFALQSHQHLSL